MDEQPYKIIISCLSQVLEENGFKYKHGETPIYVNDQYAVGVVYEEHTRMFNLLLADVDDEGTIDEFKTVSSWLFDEGHSEKHAKDIGTDFAQELKSALGIKEVRNVNASSVALPKKVKQHDKPTIESLANIIIDMFPEYKDIYKENVAKYGAFMYENFFSTTAAPALKDLVKNGDPKQMAKFVSILNHYYCNGNGELSSIITCSIIGTAFTHRNESGALVIETELWEEAKTYFTDATFLLEASNSMLKHMASEDKWGKFKFWKKKKSVK